MRPLVSEPVDGLFDFRTTRSFASAYIDTYYRDKPPTNDELRVFEFLVRHLRALPPQSVMLEVGCGPTVHHVLPFVRSVSEIHVADYLAESLAEIDKWKTGAPDACEWHQYAELVLELEGRPFAAGDVSALERLARARVTKVLSCDLTAPHVLGRDAWYPLVSAFYCTEEVGISLERWEEVMANLARLVAPGGRLFLSCLADTNFYRVGGADYPCARVTAHDLQRVLPRLGFDMSATVIESAPIEGQSDEGVVGVVLVAATKRSVRGWA
jgi:SAM-dependent methyltransferase